MLVAVGWLLMMTRTPVVICRTVNCAMRNGTVAVGKQVRQSVGRRYKVYFRLTADAETAACSAALANLSTKTSLCRDANCAVLNSCRARLMGEA